MAFSISLIIVIITVLISLGAFNNKKIYYDLIFHPPVVSRHGQWYRFFSHGLIHADGPHLIFNMLALFLFGQGVEREFQLGFGQYGKLIYLLMYLIALPVAILPTYFKNRYNQSYYSLGAAGAVCAVLFAALLLTPTVRVGFFLLPPIIPGYIFAPLYLVISAWLHKRGRDNINHSAHIWGAIFGLVFTILSMKLLADRDVITECLHAIRYSLEH